MSFSNSPNDLIPLKLGEQEDCYNFAVKAYGLQSERHYGGKARTRDEFIADQTEGKMAEMILQKFLGKLGFPVTLDWAHYLNPDQLDDGDIRAKFMDIDMRLDVKGSSIKALWLLVEEWKLLEPKKASGFCSDLYVMIKFDDTFPGNAAARQDPSIFLKQTYSGTVVGWSKPTDFRTPDGKGFWFTYNQGDFPYHPRVLPKKPPTSKYALDRYLETAIANTQARGQSVVLSKPLDAQVNYGLPIKWLCTDWNELIQILRSTSK